jgi:hypothetical protein
MKKKWPRSAPTTTNKHRKKEREPFKGKSDKMGANQFSETLKALRDYANVELENPQDLAPWFDEPCTDVVLPEPPFRQRRGNQSRTRSLFVHPMEDPM